MIGVLLKTLAIAALLNLFLVFVYFPFIPESYIKTDAIVVDYHNEKFLLINQNNQQEMLFWEYSNVDIFAKPGMHLKIAYAKKGYQEIDIIVLNSVVENYTTNKILIQFVFIGFIASYFFRKYWKQKAQDEEGFL